MHKDIIRLAAKKVRNLMLIENPDSMFSRNLVCNTLARIIWTNDVSLAKTLIERNSFISEHISIDENTVSIAEPTIFSGKVAEFKTKLFEAQRQELETALGPGTHTGKRRFFSRTLTLARLASLWTPFNKKVILSGLICSTGVTRGPDAIVAGLGQQWAPTFAAKVFDVRAAEDFLRAHPCSYSFVDAGVPNIANYLEYIRHAKHSAPGPDGIPYAACAAGGDAGAVTLDGVGSALRRGVPPPSDTISPSVSFLPRDTRKATKSKS